MGTFCHLLKPGKTARFPRNWCFVDTEARIKTLPDGREEQTLRLGSALYRRDARERNVKIEHDWDFETPRQFWDELLSRTEPTKRLIVIAYNMKYDIRILAAFPILASLGFTQTGIFVNGTVCICSWKRGKCKLTCIDACNYFKGTLEKWGTDLGIAKIDVDFRTVGKRKLLRHCRRDVAILVALWDRWRAFLSSNSLGGFAPTVAAQAMRAFRYRYMYLPIWIHDNPAAHKLERASYSGGRTECGRIGTCRRQAYTKVDVNSMYPAIMRKVPVPIKLLHVCSKPTLPALLEGLLTKGIIADVTLDARAPCYPIHDGATLLFPIGRMRTVLARPELMLAAERGEIVDVHKAAVYEQEVIFDAFVDHLWALRRQFQKAENYTWHRMVRIMMNSLYGKWGQRNPQWESVAEGTDHPNGWQTIYNGTTRTIQHVRVLAGQVWVSSGFSEARDSFPAIAATITSAARVYLWELMTAAGLSHVYYVDTDSLVVDSAGLKNIAAYIDPTQLGMLKVEKTTRRLDLYGPKDYRFGSEVKHKGVPRTAKQVKRGTYVYMQWEGLQGAIGTGHLDKVVLTPVEKTLERLYRKGHVSSSGSVSPPTSAAAN